MPRGSDSSGGESCDAVGSAAAVSPITLITDFGTHDAYVGVMKAVIAGISPGSVVIDLCHEVAPQDVRRGGVVWASAIPHCPEDSVHVAVVDPGVGSRRRVLAFQSGRTRFLAPDNGIIGFVLPVSAVERVVEVRAARLFRRPVSRTFHGRDIFAPVAAHLASGLDLSALGPETASYERLELPRPRARRRGGRLHLVGEVLDIDRFGNAITNLRRPPGHRLVELRVGQARIARVASSYSGVAPGAALAIVSSAETIEVAVRDGSASVALGIEPGAAVRSVWSPRATGRSRRSAR